MFSVSYIVPKIIYLCPDDDDDCVDQHSPQQMYSTMHLRQEHTDSVITPSLLYSQITHKL